LNEHTERRSDCQLESALADVLSIKTEREKEVSGHKISVANLEARLASEVKAREECERRGQDLIKELEKARGDRENALLVANERASWARMTDVSVRLRLEQQGSCSSPGSYTSNGAGMRLLEAVCAGIRPEEVSRIHGVEPVPWAGRNAQWARRE
jgi:hypothetical protein